MQTMINNRLTFQILALHHHLRVFISSLIISPVLKYGIAHVIFSCVAPVFIVQWLFDEEQLKVENIYMGGQSLSEEQWQYIQNLGKEIKNSLRDVT